MVGVAPRPIPNLAVPMIPLGAGPILILVVLAVAVVADQVLLIAGRRK